MTTKEFVDKIERSAVAYPESVFTGKGKVYTCVNPYSYHIVKKNETLYAELDGLFVDGMTMCWWIRLLWQRRIPRLSFDMAGMAVDLFARLNGDIPPSVADMKSPGSHVDSGSTSKDTPSTDSLSDETIYFIGAKQDEIEATIRQIRHSYPKMKIAGYRNGYFSTEAERRAAISEIIELNPSFVIVGMGSPLQERFVIDLRDSGFKGIAFTCGGFLHQTADRMHYYPQWVNRLNLRAFYRLFHEKGMVARLWQVLVAFPLRFTLDSLRSSR